MCKIPFKFSATHMRCELIDLCFCFNLGVNMLWRCALLAAAARSLRQNIHRGRIWCNPSSDPEQEQEQERTPFCTALRASSSSSSPLDIPLTSGDAKAGSKRCRTQRLGLPTSPYPIHFSKRICEFFGFVYLFAITFLRSLHDFTLL